MTKLKRTLLVTAMSVISLWTATNAIGLGIPFGFQGGPAAGVRLDFSELYTMQPTLILNITEDETNFNISIDNNFNIAETEMLKHYLGVNFNIDDNGDFGTAAYYGLQHQVNEAIDIYGQLGLGITFDPTFMSTFNTGVGVVFYIMRLGN